MRIVLLGLSITSSWGNGHATNYRGLVRALAGRGHDVVFLERDRPWYAAARDLPRPPWGRTELYGSLDELAAFTPEVAAAGLVVVGSYVPDGVSVCEWALDTARGVTAFYDLDMPVTWEKLGAGDHEYLTPELVPRFDLYLSFTGGPLLARLEGELGARRAVAFHCFVDPDAHRPLDVPRRWDLGYLGTYSPDRQAALDALLVEPARAEPGRRFVIAGPQYPDAVVNLDNIDHLDHVAPPGHAAFYAAQRFTLSVTRAPMAAAGWSPSVRLFEAAACGVPVISDAWPGLEAFFEPGREILVARETADVLGFLRDVGDGEAAAVGRRARARVLREHTAERRAAELERLAAPVAVP